jgi:tetratricopeptide (TPR) repeat protein
VPPVPSLSLGKADEGLQPAASPLPAAPPPAEAVAAPTAPPAEAAASEPAPAKAAGPASPPAPAPAPRREDIDRADAQDLPSRAPAATAAPTPSPEAAPEVEAAAPAAKPSAKPERKGPAKPLALAPPPAAVAPAKPAEAPTGNAAPDTTPPKADAAAPSPQAETAASPAPEPAPEPPARFSMALDARATSVDLRFDWGLPVRAAAFRRAGFVWLIFDRPAEVPLDSLRGAGNILVEAEQLPDPVGTVLRMVVRSGFNPQVESEGRAWRVRFAQQPPEPRIPIGLQGGVKTDAGPHMVIPTGQAGSVMRIADPEVGDTLLVVPLSLGGEGIAAPRQFMDLRLLQTTQGVVIEPFRDDLLVRAGGQGIWLSTRGGLFVSEAPPEGIEPVQGPRRLLAFAEWRGDEEGFRNRKQALNQAIADAAEGQRNAPRMDLARFYFANGLYSETLGVLYVVSSTAPDMADDAEFRLLRGASHFLVGRRAEALADLTAPVLSDDPDGRLLRAALLAESGDLTHAGELFTQSGGPPTDYPRRLRLRLGLLYAEAMLAADAVDEAADALHALADIEPDAGDAAYLAYLNAMLQHARGETDAATTALQALAESEDPRARAKATFALVEQGLADKSMDSAAAIDRLERLQFAWRGDQLEYDVLRQLGRLYIEAGEPAKGLTVLQRAVTQFPEHPDNEALNEEMQRQFVRMFTGDDAPPLSPLKALALFNDFRDLIPTGAASDTILQDLAERLVAVDLLDRAAALLRHQVRFRLDGIPRARVGSRLAAIELLDDKPEAALEALESTDELGLPAPLAGERNLVKARALMALNRGNEALVTLAGDEDIMADEVRAEIYQRAGEWNKVAEVLQRQVDRVDPKAANIEEPTARILLRWAVALALDSDFDALKAARERYGEVMQASAYRDPFQLITSRASPLADIRAVADTVAQADAFLSFIAKGGQMAADAEKAEAGAAADAAAAPDQNL